MGYSLNSLREGYIGGYIGTTIGVIKGDTRSLDYGSHIYICKEFHVNGAALGQPPELQIRWTFKTQADFQTLTSPQPSSTSRLRRHPCAPRARQKDS